MKILYFHQHFSTPQGATGIRSYEMAKALIAAGHQVTMVCGTYSGGNTGLQSAFENGVRKGCVDGINIIEFELTYANQQSFIERTKVFLKFAFRSVKVALTEQYDLLFATTTPLTAAIPGIFAKWFRRKPFVFEVRDLWPELPKAMGVITNPVILAGMGVLEWLAYKSSDKQIALSPGIQQGIERHLSDSFKANHPVSMVPNGCDLAIFAKDVEPWQPAGIEDEDFVAIFSGTHGIANDLGQVVATAEKLRARKLSHIKFVLIGQGQQKQSLQQVVLDKQLNNIIFLEPVNKTELSRLMKRANVGLQLLADVPAFYYGTSPNKFFDYLSAGKPIINNYSGWVADIITKENCGIAISPNKADEFADALVALSQDQVRCEQMAKNSLLVAQHQFAREKLAAQFVNALEEVAPNA